jgi:hypothetical protein
MPSSVQRLLDIDGLERLQQTLAGWVGSVLHQAELKRDPVWTESIAVGNPEFLEAFQSSASHLRHSQFSRENGICSLREGPSPYEVGSAHEIGHLRGENRQLLVNNL